MRPHPARSRLVRVGTSSALACSIHTLACALHVFTCALHVSVRPTWSLCCVKVCSPRVHGFCVHVCSPCVSVCALHVSVWPTWSLCCVRVCSWVLCSRVLSVCSCVLYVCSRVLSMFTCALRVCALCGGRARSRLFTGSNVSSGCRPSSSDAGHNYDVVRVRQPSCCGPTCFYSSFPAF